MTTVVKTARATNAGIAASRLKVDMGDMYKLEDDEGALFVTANMLGSKPAGNYEVNWHTKELRPKSTSTAASGLAAATSFDVASGEGTFVQINDYVMLPVTQESMLVTGVSGDTLTVTRSFGTNAAANFAASTQVLIVSPHYGEGATLQDGRTTTETLFTNNVALWRHNFKITGTLQAISEQGGTFHGSDVVEQREDMMLTHKRDINQACLFTEKGASGTLRSMMGMIEFIEDNGTSRTDSTSAVTFGVFMANSQVATRYNSRKMVGIVSRQFATIVSQWALGTGSTVHVAPGAKMFGLQVMDITTPHGTFRLLVDDALEGVTYQKYGLFIDGDKKTGPKWRYLRKTRIMKDREENDEDAYEEEVLTEGSIELGNPDFHYLYKNAQTAA